MQYRQHGHAGFPHVRMRPQSHPQSVFDCKVLDRQKKIGLFGRLSLGYPHLTVSIW
jgi:hypothetical protein